MIAPVIPARVYLDTSVVVAAISTGDPSYAACTAYCAALASHNSTIVFSQLLRLEYAQFIRKLATDAKSAVSPQLFQQYQLKDYSTNMMIRHQWTHFMQSQFNALLATFYRVREVPVMAIIPQKSVALMSLHNIESYDAAHVATALQERISILATTDKTFANRVNSGLRVYLVQ